MFSLAKQSLNVVPRTPEVSIMHGATDKSTLPSLYHGSPNLIKPGEMIKTGGPWSQKFAHATGTPAIASEYAVGRSRAGMEKGSSAPSQGALWSVLHKVSPAAGAEVNKDISTHGKSLDAYVSKQFKVDKPVALVDNSTGYVSPTGKEQIPGQSTPGTRLTRPPARGAYQPPLFYETSNNGRTVTGA
jgi:hypothetical protein